MRRTHFQKQEKTKRKSVQHTPPAMTGTPQAERWQPSEAKLSRKEIAKKEKEAQQAETSPQDTEATTSAAAPAAKGGTKQFSETVHFKDDDRNTQNAAKHLFVKTSRAKIKTHMAAVLQKDLHVKVEVVTSTPDDNGYIASVNSVTVRGNSPERVQLAKVFVKAVCKEGRRFNADLLNEELTPSRINGMMADFKRKNAPKAKFNGVSAPRQEQMQQSADFGYQLPKHALVKPRTVNQGAALAAIDLSKVVFLDGPEGTGKSYLPIAKAYEALKNKQIERIIFIRPLVAAGEDPGTLPGDMGAKTAPYTGAMFDNLREAMKASGITNPDAEIEHMIKTKQLEVRVAGFLRGATLRNAYIVIDEAENFDQHQLNLILTRADDSCKILINGDMSQSDLRGGRTGGMGWWQDCLKDLPTVKVVTFTEDDIVRSELTKSIVIARDAKKARERAERDAKLEQQPSATVREIRAPAPRNG